MNTSMPVYPEQGIQTYPMGSDVKHICQRLMNFHVIAQMRDGSKFDGIIEGIDDDGVTMLVPEEIDADWENDQSNRQFGYGRRRFRRFRRQRFPFINFAFPFFIPYPYFYPQYPYFPSYGYGGGYGGGI